MKLDPNLWKMEHWKWGGSDPELLKKEPAYIHAFYVPGVGWFGGHPPGIAEFIVDCVNSEMDQEAAEVKGPAAVADLERGPVV